MATTKAAKTATTTSSGGTKAKGKRSGGEGKSTPMASHFPMPTGAFTVEVPVDPGPKRSRHSFSKIPHVLELPNLIELQKASFEWFKTEGLAEAFAAISPIKDFTGNLILMFGEHSLGEPKFSIEECRERDMTYSAPLRVRVRLITAESGEIKGIPDQEIFMGDFPLMTDKGTFMINGAERVIVSQLVRSPGFLVEKAKPAEGKGYTAKIIPKRGAWVKFFAGASDEGDRFGAINVSFDKSRAVSMIAFLRAVSSPEHFPLDDAPAAAYDADGLARPYVEKVLRACADMFPWKGIGRQATAASDAIEVPRPQSQHERQVRDVFATMFPNRIARGEAFDLVVELGDKSKRDAAAAKLSALYHRNCVWNSDEAILKLFSGTYPRRRVDDGTSRPLGRAPRGLKKKQQTSDRAAELRELFDRLFPDASPDNLILNTLIEDGDTVNRETALEAVYGALRYGEPFTSHEDAEKLIRTLLFDENKCELGKVGRFKVTSKLHYRILNPEKDSRIRAKSEKKGLNLSLLTVEGDRSEFEVDEFGPFSYRPEGAPGLTRADFIAIVRRLCRVAVRDISPDDVDHLGNRRVNTVGELLQNQFRVGLQRLERVVRERMTTQEIETVTPQALINIRPVVAAIKEFFGSSQLSQFMDQTNSLAELTHKRRLSALGPGGLSRERAGFEARDVHTSHYGRICPIETPEGPNIGLIGSLATYGRVNSLGFIETPYRIVRDGRVTDEIRYFTADVEEEFIIGQANTPLAADGTILAKTVVCRHRGDDIEEPAGRVELMDISPKQIVSVATALIPFLEHDDANRALMGANMQRQAVPLLRPQAPIVGTGMEYRAAKDSGSLVVADEAGTVIAVDATQIVLETADGEKVYELLKFVRSNAGTCINQRPIVTMGEKVVAGQVLADGPTSDEGELALGQNVLVAFMPWEGYNYEDAILISERMVKEDRFTSIHIEEYECEARDTKLGPEEITRDIPNVGEDALKDLDERGIIRIGAEVRPEDILVGKVTPKGETELTAEERLLRAIFGEKSREVRDTSLKVPHGEKGKIIDVKVFSRENGDELSPGVNHLVRVYVAQKRKILQGDKMAGRHGNKGVIAKVLPEEDMPYLEDGTPVDIVLNPLGVPSRMNIGQILETHLGWAARMLGFQIATPVFDGATAEDIEDWLQDAGLPSDGKAWLRDGRSGDRFDRPITVGMIYMLKLAHLVDDKIHARSTGPYSMITQQPLGGKAQFGGQRFGEMEVWALEAYGAAYTLQELLTVKSDDVVGRVKTYEAIVKGENVMEPGVPESFKVLIKELQSLALDVKVLTESREEIDTRELRLGNDDLGLNEEVAYGVLMGAEDPLLSQTQVAAAEAVAAAAADGVLPEIEAEEEAEEEEEEIDDSKPFVAGPIPAAPTVARAAEIEGDDIFAADEEIAVDDDLEGPQGYELEEEEDEIVDDDAPAFAVDDDEVVYPDAGTVEEEF
uniref:DNA-directed RNA polymerase n=1 Tax=mine drainage metagenome TaxID=410659 RepID=E6PFL5_9ZZZZ